jgi:hypothetical protein
MQKEGLRMGQDAELQVAVENRMWPRQRCEITTICSTLRGRWTCKIVDLSERGLGIEIPTTLQKGAVLDFIDPRTRARVVWAEENRAGLRIIN